MTIKDLALGLLVMAIWGVNFVVIRLGVEQLDPLLLTAGRFALATWPILLFIPRPQTPWRFILGYALVFGTGVWGLVTLSIQAGLSAGMASLLLQVNVAISLLIAWLFLGEKLAWNKHLGAVLTMSGLAVSLFIEDGSVTLSGLLLVLLGASCWAASGLIVKAAKPQKVFAFSVWAMAFAPFPLLLIGLVQQGPSLFDTSQLDELGWFSLLFQAWPTTLLGYWLWNRLLLNYPLSSVAPLTLLVPVFGLLSSSGFYHEPIGQLKQLAAGLIIGGLICGLLKPTASPVLKTARR